MIRKQHSHEYAVGHNIHFTGWKWSGAYVTGGVHALLNNMVRPMYAQIDPVRQDIRRSITEAL